MIYAGGMHTGCVNKYHIGDGGIDTKIRRFIYETSVALYDIHKNGSARDYQVSSEVVDGNNYITMTS